MKHTKKEKELIFTTAKEVLIANIENGISWPKGEGLAQIAKTIEKVYDEIK